MMISPENNLSKMHAIEKSYYGLKVTSLPFLENENKIYLWRDI